MERRRQTPIYWAGQGRTSIHLSVYLAVREFAPQKLPLCKGRRPRRSRSVVNPLFSLMADSSLYARKPCIKGCLLQKIRPMIVIIGRIHCFMNPRLIPAVFLSFKRGCLYFIVLFHSGREKQPGSSIGTLRLNPQSGPAAPPKAPPP